jgi:membrane protein
VKEFIKEIYRIWVSERPTQLAAALAYFGLFSFAPVIYISFIVAGFFIDKSILLERLMTSLGATLGPGITKVIVDLLNNLSPLFADGSWFISAVSFIFILLAASGVFYQLQFVLNTIWRVPIPRERLMLRTIRKQGFSFLMVLAFGLLLVAAAVLGFMANWLNSLFTLIGLEPSLTTLFFFAMAALSFAVMYKILPEVKIKWRDVWGGAIIAAGLVTVGGWLVVFFIKNTSFASALEVTGSFIVLLTGFYYFAQIFLMGAIITRIYAHRYGSLRQTPEEAPAASNQNE